MLPTQRRNNTGSARHTQRRAAQHVNAQSPARRPKTHSLHFPFILIILAIFAILVIVSIVKSCSANTQAETPIDEDYTPTLTIEHVEATPITDSSTLTSYFSTIQGDSDLIIEAASSIPTDDSLQTFDLVGNENAHTYRRSDKHH